MKRIATLTGCIALTLAGCQTMPATSPNGASAQTPAAMRTQPQAAPRPAGATFKREEIEALVAPIALYPDSVLSQALMASTYPMEVVLAARWAKAHPDLKGDAAIKAVEKEPWDVSVKSLVAFPQVLEPMNDNIDWMQNLGDAFLAQEKDVFEAVQRLRAKARQTGNLQSNAQQKVTTETTASGQSVVIIEPADPQTIYIPAYDPGVVYGAWAYPAYPYYYWPPYPAYYPGYAYGAGLAWGVGLVTAAAIFSNANWNNNSVHIEHHKARNIDRNFDSSKLDGSRWQHDARHRQGVAYRDNASREKFGRSSPGAEARNGFRGREGAATRDSGFRGVSNGRGEIQRDLNRGNSSLGSARGNAGGFRGSSGGGRGFGGGGGGGRGGGRGGRR